MVVSFFAFISPSEYVIRYKSFSNLRDPKASAFVALDKSDLIICCRSCDIPNLSNSTSFKSIPSMPVSKYLNSHSNPSFRSSSLTAFSMPPCLYWVPGKRTFKVSINQSFTARRSSMLETLALRLRLMTSWRNN